MTHQNAALLLGALLIAAIVGVSKLGYDEFAVVKSGAVLRFYDAPVLRKSFFVVFVDLTMIAASLYLAIGLKYDDWGVQHHRDMLIGIAALVRRRRWPCSRRCGSIAGRGATPASTTVPS